MSMDMNADTILVCPYDKSHGIAAVRMPYHLIKCRKNFPTTDLVVCPFNACHEIHKAELRYHMLHCPNRSLLEKDIAFDVMLKAAHDGKISKLKGCTDLPKYKDDLLLGSDDVEENWDDELGHSTFLAFPNANNAATTRFQSTKTTRCDSDTTLPLRLPATEGKAAKLASTSAPVSCKSASHSSSQLLFDFLSRGRGRARPTLVESRRPGVVPTLRPNIPSSLSKQCLPSHNNNSPSQSTSSFPTQFNNPVMSSQICSTLGRGSGILASTLR